MTKWQNFILSNRNPLIDVRAPCEFIKGSIPGAINLPLLENSEREKVGTVFKQEGSAAAVQLGLELLSTRIEDYQKRFREVLGEPSPANTPMIYCWRGGMRSTLVELWLKAQGYSPIKLESGYKGFRQDVSTIIDAFANHQMIVLHGRTGSGKTDIIEALLKQDLPTVDFEGCAGHRGSAFGDFCTEEEATNQQQFENRLAASYLKVKHHPILVLEIENLIGPVALPVKLRNSVREAPIILLDRSIENRVKCLSKHYTEKWKDSDNDKFLERLSWMKDYLSNAQKASLHKSVVDGNFSLVIEQLLSWRYDPVYDKGIKKRGPQIIAHLKLESAEISQENIAEIIKIAHTQI